MFNNIINAKQRNKDNKNCLGTEHTPWEGGDLNNNYQDKQKENACCVRLEHSVFFLRILQ